MQPIKIAWNKVGTVAPDADLQAALAPSEWNRLLGLSRNPKHPSYALSPDLFVEIPTPNFGRGELLIYLPLRGWLVRKNYRDAWYVDIGLMRHMTEDLYTWTDLWLDVIMPEPATSYRLLDADEFAAVLRAGQVSPAVAAYAMDRLHDLLTTVESGMFPPPEVREAEQMAAALVGKGLAGNQAASGAVEQMR